MRLTIIAFSIVILLFNCSQKPTKKRFKAHYTHLAPVVDGDAKDSIWHAIPYWNTEQYTWINNVNSEPPAADFSWKYKLAWDENKFYVLAEIRDDVISDVHPDPKNLYYQDDCFEVLFDEDNSGGDHEVSYQAFVYHISILHDVLDIDTEGNRVLLNDHVEIRMDTLNGTSIWEAAFDIYDEGYISTDKSNPVKLHKGKVMGWGMAYCDNDGEENRDHFIGSHFIPGKDKNVTWRSADAFAEVKLVE
ncbi:sugar-binding protein [Ekhidna sp.]